MGEPTRTAGGITMLDGAALVTGAAVASVHFRDFDDEVAGLTLLGWSLIIGAFAWLSLTAAGPFVYLVRRFSRRPDGYPGPWDGLWLAIGLPWLIAALYRSGAGSIGGEAASAYSSALFAGLFLASGLVLRRLLATWAAPPGPAAGAASWTGRIGQAVSVAWPIQLGLGFVVTK